MNLDEKLIVLYININANNGQVSNIERKLDKCLQTSNKLHVLESNLTDIDKRLLLLEYKSLDLESRSRRKNLIFTGFKEERNENCNAKVKSLKKIYRYTMT